MNLFKQLSQEEEVEFRSWARDNYKPFTEISGLWHPCIQDECRVINEEAGKDLDIFDEINLLEEAEDVE